MRKKRSASFEERLERQQEAVRRRARGRIYLKDPLVTKATGLLYDFVVVGSDTSIAEGPTSSRFIVVDYDPTSDRVESPARSRLKVVDWSRTRREQLYEFEARRGTPQEAQINAWATAVDTLDLFQQPQALGREIPWAFEGGRLRILPHACYEANAFYSRQTRALHFGYFVGKDGDTVKTALSHDVVAHETSHAILDGLRPLYLNSLMPDTLAFHEYIGDLGAMLSLFRNREMVAHMSESTQRRGSFFDLISDLAPQVGEGLYGDADRSFLRSADNRLRYSDVKKESEIHKRSQVLSGFAFDLFREIFVKLQQVSYKPRRYRDLKHRDVFPILTRTARHLGRLLLRPLDLLPPGSISFREYAAILLQVDELDFPEDRLGYRKIMKAAMRKRGILPSWETNQPASSGQRRAIERNMLERNMSTIRSSRVGAYKFLDANRGRFRIPVDRDFRVVGLATNQREADFGFRPTAETIIQYVWDERIKLPKDRRPSGVDWVAFPVGGTVAIDDNVNLLYLITQEIDYETEELVKSQVNGLLKDRAVDFEPSRFLQSGRPFLLQREPGGQARLQVNTARMHAGRGKRS